MQLITHSRSQSFKTCRKAHFYSYEAGIRPLLDAKALRQGTAYHAGLESWANCHDLDAAVQATRDVYMHTPEVIDQREWEIECETVVRLVCGYTWRWENNPITHVVAEQSFKLPLVNPETGKPSKTFQLAGKIDGIVTLEDGRLAVLEHKLLGDDIGPDSELWRRMRMDHQISLYVMAARQLGHEVTTVLYDVARKPTIRPANVPILDKLGTKIVLDYAGNRVQTKDGKFRQTGDKEKGYILQERECTPDEWGERLSADIAERPDWYYQRIEIPRMDDALADYQSELWDIAKTIREAQIGNRHYRTVSKQTCPFCSYFGLCERNFNPESDSLPESFVRLKNLHPELELSHASAPTGPAEAVTATTSDGQQYEPFDQPF